MTGQNSTHLLIVDDEDQIREGTIVFMKKFFHTIFYFYILYLNYLFTEMIIAHTSFPVNIYHIYLIYSNNCGIIFLINIRYLCLITGRVYVRGKI